MNFNGWGPLSDILYVRAVAIAQKPPAPQYVSSNSTHITIQIVPTADDSGADVSSYELYIDTIQATANFQLLSSGATTTRVQEFAPPTTATAAEITAWQTANAGVVASLERGKAYRLVSKAVNFMGTSDASEELRVALGGLPA